MSPEDELLYRRLVKALNKGEPLTAIEASEKEIRRVLLWHCKYGWTLLHHALDCFMRGQLPLEEIQYLVHACPMSLAVVDYQQRTPLHIACETMRSVKTGRLLESYAEIKDGKDQTSLPFACRCDDNFKCIQLLVESFPRSARMQNFRGNTPLHSARFCSDKKAIQYLATVWPIACLLYTFKSRYYSDTPPQLVLDMYEESGASSLEINTFLSETTMDATYALVDAMFHSLSRVPRAVVLHVEKTLSPHIVATIKANGMMINEKIDFSTIKDVLKHQTVQTMLQDELCATLVHGFFEMNKAGRKGVVRSETDSIQSIAVCASVSDNAGCLFAHLRENPSFCKCQ